MSGKLMMAIGEGRWAGGIGTRVAVFFLFDI